MLKNLGGSQPPLLEIPITTLRLPIFCSDNKPFIFIKVLNDSEKYRISVNPDFLKNYNLKFKILRDHSLDNFISNLKGQISNSLKIGTNTGTCVSMYLKLPDRNKALIQKHTIVLENDGVPGKTLIDKYQIQLSTNIDAERNIIYIIERIYNGERNTSITFISEEFENFYDFLNVYHKLL